MVVDHSGSISQSELNSIKGGIRSFIDTFAGTPIKLQVVTFGDDAATLGTTAGVWGKYFDMLDDTDVATLKGLVGDPLVTSSGIQRGGWTNWEDALFRMLRNSDGTLQAQLPGTMIFFTDGVPTKSRLDYTSASAAAVDDPLDDGLDDDSGSFRQISWNRAERIVRDRGSIKIIGVYVSPDELAESEWIVRGEAYLYEVGNGVVYEVGAPGYRRNNNVIFQISGKNMSYQRLSGSSWVSAASGYSATSSQARAAYLANNTTPDSTDNWRFTKSGSPGSWQTITAAQYAASNTSSGTGDGLRTAVSGGLSSNWTIVTQAEYNLSNTNTGTSDGWDLATVWSPTTFDAYTAGNVDSVAVVPFDTGASALDLNPTPGVVDTLVSPTADADGNGVHDVVTFLKSLRVRGGTNFVPAARTACQVLASSGSPNLVAAFLSDGEQSSRVDSVVPCDPPVTFQTFAVGAGSKCVPNNRTNTRLVDLATLTGGTCTDVPVVDEPVAAAAPAR